MNFFQVDGNLTIPQILAREMWNVQVSSPVGLLPVFDPSLSTARRQSFLRVDRLSQLLSTVQLASGTGETFLLKRELVAMVIGSRDHCAVTARQLFR